MGQECKICNHPKRAKIDEALVKGISARRIAAKLDGVSHHSILRHKKDHLPASLTKVVVERIRDDESRSLLDRIEDLITRSERILDTAEDAGNTHQTLGAIRELRSCLELLGKATGELRDSPSLVVNIATMPEWIAIREAMFQALGPHPDARIAVAERLQLLEGGNT